MRIIAGVHRSRKLNTLEGMNTRPMTDRMKESIFNTIGPYFDGGKVLDLFGGSGALSLEAISRGMSEAYIIDIFMDAIKIITENVKVLNEECKVHIYKMDYEQALNKFADLKFDLIFLDPPYRMNINNEIINFILNHKMLNRGGLIVCQYVRGNMKPVKGLSLRKNYTTGSSEVSIYELNNENEIN